MILQEFGGRGNIHTSSRHDFYDEVETRKLYDKVKVAHEYLSDILGIDEEDENKTEVETEDEEENEDEIEDEDETVVKN